jgi:hypothetical protein
MQGNGMRSIVHAALRYGCFVISSHAFMVHGNMFTLNADPNKSDFVQMVVRICISS